MAINVASDFYSLEEWGSFWEYLFDDGAGELLLAQDINNSVKEEFQLFALGTEILIDRQGRVAFRSDGPAGYDELRSEIEKVL